MEEGLIFVALLAVSLFSMAWIALLLYGLYRLGRWLGERHPSLRWPWLPTASICGIGLVSACGLMLLPLDRLTRFCFGLIVWVAVVHPLLVGYWFARSKFKQQNSRLLWKRTQQWLAEWENRRDSPR